MLDDSHEASQAMGAVPNIELALETRSSLPEIPVATEENDSKHDGISAGDSATLRSRLAAKIEALRVSRKAAGTQGRPVSTRQELIENRRVRHAQMKARKQQLRVQAKAIGTPQLTLNPIGSDTTNQQEHVDDDANFAFGRVAFNDGSQLSHGLDYLLNRDHVKRRGPSDPKTALMKLQTHRKRIAAMDDDIRLGVEEKEIWVSARHRAEGHKVCNDESMLKRTIKRKETAKKKSKREWADRVRAVEKSRHQKQKKRDTNIKDRRDSKIAHKLGRKYHISSQGRAAGPKARPGFEGRP
jgi:hypothetical protein